MSRLTFRLSLQLSILALSCVFLFSCASVESVSLTPIPAKRSQVVRAEVSKTIFLAFNFDNDFIDPLVAQLKDQCPNGVVSGILTKDEVLWYIIVHTRKVTATGFCNVSSAQGSKEQLIPKTRKAASVPDVGV